MGRPSERRGAPPRRAARLLETLGPDGLAAADAAQWAAACGAPVENAQRWRAAALAFDAVREEARAQALGARVVVLGDSEYPDLLASIHDPPLVLYVIGSFADRPAAAFVGSRFPTPYGRRAARRLAGETARAGAAIVSGLARGIDAEAHLAALEAKAPTYAVLGGGLGNVYPAENRGLARRIVAEGARSSRRCRSTRGWRRSCSRAATGSSPGCPGRSSWSRAGRSPARRSPRAWRSTRAARCWPSPGPTTRPCRRRRTACCATAPAR
ncbi:MAG: DNA-protecting protein DprA [Elusimicrobiota bacterium]|nr:MAG: DNA-protecting protein DprA [Elusimicrobiota bacterium]